LLADRGEVQEGKKGEKGQEGKGKDEEVEREARREHPTPRGSGGSDAFLQNVRALLRDETFLLLSAAGNILTVTL
jgi:hypothetical protein